MEREVEMRGVTLVGDERVDRLREGRWIVQRARGHRATTDDQLLAWAALDELDQLNARPLHWQRSAPLTILELGAGKGTVTLWLSASLHQALFFGVEAFEESYSLALKNRQLNQLEGRFFPTHGDLRDHEHLSALSASRASLLAQLGHHDHTGAGFELVLGAPPFMPLGSGVLPQDAQRAAGRFEQRGGVEAYMSAVSVSLSQEGFAVILMDGNGEIRARSAAEEEGLVVTRALRVKPRPDRPATYSILWLRQPSEERHVRPLSALNCSSLSMRDAQGDEWSPAYQAVRERLGLSS